MENNNSETVPVGAGVTPSGSGESVSDVNKGDLTLEVLNQVLGKDFKDVTTALKSIKDTSNFVGTYKTYKEKLETASKKFGVDENGVLNLMENLVKQPQATPTPKVEATTGELSKLTQEVGDLKFFKQNPAFEKHEKFLKELRGNTGKSFDEIITMETFKDVLGKLDAHDEIEKSKSVMRSNSRIGQAKDKLTKAKEAGTEAERGQLAAEAVLEAFDLK